MKKLILIVCNGNIHRSVIAEQCINRALQQNGLEIKYAAVSRGLQGTGNTKLPQYRNLQGYPLEWSMSEPFLAKFGIIIPENQVTTSVDAKIVGEATLILVMDRGTLLERPNSLVRQFPLSGFKMRLFRELEGKTDDVPDCFGQRDPNYYRRTISMIDSIVKNCTKHMIALAEILTIQKESKSE